MPIRNIFVIAVTAIVSMTCYSTATKNRYANLFAEALDTIEQRALQNVPKSELFTHAMQGMTSRLDGHSRFISGEMFRAFDEDLKQQFGGVGMYVENDPTSDNLTVLSPIPGTPAFRAGIRAGDIIVEIAGVSTNGIDRTKAVELIRGPEGEAVEVVTERNGERIVNQLVREFIHEPSVHGDYRQGDGSWVYRMKDHPRIGYIRLLQFGNKSSLEMREAIETIKDDVDGLIFDLRNNTGGLLDGAIEICDLFLSPSEAIVSTRGRMNVLLEEHSARSPPLFDSDKPVVVLINRNSASASEIVSACLQDHERAVVVGEMSWGKGTVQHVIPMERGRSALKLTTASYWRPSGKNIDRFDEQAKTSGIWGVQPNEGKSIELSQEAVFDNQRRRSLWDLRGLVSPNELAERDDGKLMQGVDLPIQMALESFGLQTPSSDADASEVSTPKAEIESKPGE